MSLSIEKIKPRFMYGTAWKEDRTEACVSAALAAGFRAIDTANQRKHYFEAGVGAALAKAFKGGLRREELFLQTKFTYQRGQDHRLPYDPQAPYSEQVEQSFESSLEHLGLTYLDSYVLHGPETGGPLTRGDWEVWRAMEAQARAGRTKVLGLSNTSASQLRELLAKAEIPPTFVQNRCYANRRWDSDVRELCAKNKIIYQGFSLLTANRNLLNHPRMLELSKSRGCNTAQLIFIFSQALGMLPLTGTTSPVHMKEDLAIEDHPEWSLSKPEIDEIETLGL